MDREQLRSEKAEILLGCEGTFSERSSATGVFKGWFHWPFT